MFLNIHDLVRIELVGEPKEIQQFFRDEMGFFETNSLDKDLDIRITFTKQIELGDDVKFIGTTMAYQGEVLYLIEGGKKIRIPLKALEERKYEVICETGFPFSRLQGLLVIFFIEQVLLNKGATFVHSSGVCFNDKSLLFAAWANTGKTSMAMEFLDKGADYISEDLPIVKKDGTILAYPGRLNLVGPTAVRLLKKKRFFNQEYMMWNIIKSALLVFGIVFQKAPVDSIKRAGIIASQREQELIPGVQVSYSAIFPHARIRKSTNLDTVFFLTKTTASEIEIEEPESEFIIDKICCSLLYETNLTAPGLYEFLRFAFPREGKSWIEEREKKIKQIMTEAFRGKRLYYVKLPSTKLAPSQAFDKLIKCL